MKSFLIFIALCATSLPALSLETASILNQPSSQVSNTEAQNQFSKLNELFQVAQPAQLNDVLGGYSGRCYIHNQGSTPTNQLLVGVTQPVGIDNGPLFPVTSVTKVLAIVSSGQPAGYFDNLNETTKAEVYQTTSRFFSKYEALRLIDGSLAAVYMEGNLDIRIRKYQGYLLTQALLIRDSEADKLKAGDIYAACYFFKKVL